MSSELRLSVGQYSCKGRKQINQDFYGVYVPKQPQLSSKGVAIVVADGISSSDVSQVASQAAVTGFLEDYFCTSDAWSVKKSAQRVLAAINSWLFAQTRQSQHRFDKDRGYVCTLSAMVIKSSTAHIFHVGDSRIYRLRGNTLEQLTEDHRYFVSPETSYLSRAMGISQQLEIDYQALPVDAADVFLFATDGVYEHVKPRFIIDAISAHGDALDQAAQAIVRQAYEKGSNDNLTAQIVRVDELPGYDATEIHQQANALPIPPPLEARMSFDGYTIVRELHASSRSHVYLAVDGETNTPVIIKTPSIELQSDPAYLERLLMEEWIARRINSAHVVKPFAEHRKRNYLYVATEFIDGQSLAQWIIDNPKPALGTVRAMVEQIAKGLRAFHRLEMLHQDLQPANIMIDKTGTLRIIDFGSTRVAGIEEIETPVERSNLLGIEQYAAPEYFLGENGTVRSDIFSLGVVTYQMLTGKLPYGTQVPKSRTKQAQRKLKYGSALVDRPQVPVWIDDAIKKAVDPSPHKRYQDLSEFLFDLHHPNQAFQSRRRTPLLERNPVAFWRGVSLILAIIILLLLGARQLG